MDTTTFLSKYQPQVNGKNRFLFFAPGRINLMGDHTDTTGGFVLPATLSRGTYLFAQKIPENEIRLYSLNLEKKKTVSLENPLHPAKDWTDYPMGVIHEIIQQGWKPQGLELIYFGDLPMNAGLSSSASIEMVTALALNQMFSLALPDKTLALLSQAAEHHFAGVQCGIMDPYAIAFGRPGQALLMDCHNITHREIPIHLDGYQWVAVNSNVKHELSQSIYNQRVEELKQVHETINSFFEVPYLGMLTGEDHEWLDKLVEDPLLKKRLRHVVNENTRVQAAAEMLEKKDAMGFGRLMYDSHDSLAYDFEVSCKELDVLVKIASETEGVAGARLTGAGFGGCTLNLVSSDRIPLFIEKIQNDFEKMTGKKATVYPLSLTGEKGMIS